MRNSIKIGIALIVASLLGCYPLTTTNKEWKIKDDPTELSKKEIYLKSLKQDPAKKYNVILIMADDLGKNEVSCYNPKSDVPTPNIDKISEEGVHFNNAYVTAPICSPSRAAILTGRYQQRFGFESQPMDLYPTNGLEYRMGSKNKKLGDWRVSTDHSYPGPGQIAKQGIPNSEITIAEIFKAVGYHTAIFGKWHLGNFNSYVPNSKGFEEQYGFYGAFSLYTPKHKTPGYVNFIQDDFSSEHQWNTARYGSSAIRENDKKVIEKEYLTFALRDRAIDFMRRNKDSNFLMYVAFNAPHVPFQAPQEYYDRFPEVKDSNRRVYLAMIAALDDAIGDIMKEVKALGLEENTIIYFLSDNGGASYTKATDNGRYKGGKLTHFDGGVNVPMAMYWKGKTQSMKFEHPISTTDIFMTSLINCGIAPPKDRILDGVDLLPHFKANTAPHDKIFWRSNHIEGMRYKNLKILYSERDQWMHLYDIEKDIYEEFDLKETQPEKVESLKAILKSWIKQLPEKPLWPRIMDRKFVIDGETYYFPA
ncbi:MAG: sulfatase-like hydrolase/transferase [Crocinitomicaceae bacterium]